MIAPDDEGGDVSEFTAYVLGQIQLGQLHTGVLGLLRRQPLRPVAGPHHLYQAPARRPTELQLGVGDYIQDRRILVVKFGLPVPLRRPRRSP